MISPIRVVVSKQPEKLNTFQLFVGWRSPLSDEDIGRFAASAPDHQFFASTVVAMRAGRGSSDCELYNATFIDAGDAAMVQAAYPVLAPTSGRSMGQLARRLVLFDRAKDAMGGARKLGEVVGLSRRSVNNKLVADRTLTDFELKLAADAIEARAREFDQLAADIRNVLS